MKKVLSLITCSILAACSCNESQWEEVDTVVYDEPVYIEEAPVVEEKTVYVPTPVYDQPYAEVACCQPTPCVQMQPCCQSMPAPQPKVTTTKKIITTTTTVEEPCGKPVCEPVVTTHEEIVPVEVNTNLPAENTLAPTVVNSQLDTVQVTVEKSPYSSEEVEMSKTTNSTAKPVSKYSPEVYTVVATRATNRMLQDTSAIYDSGKTKKLYIKDTKLLSNDLPYGSHRLKGTVKDIVSGSKTFEVVNNINNADFIVETSADWYVAPNNTIPALQYKLALLDKNGKKVNDWIEVIRQVQE